MTSWVWVLVAVLVPLYVLGVLVVAPLMYIHVTIPDDGPRGIQHVIGALFLALVFWVPIAFGIGLFKVLLFVMRGPKRYLDWTLRQAEARGWD